MILTCFCYVVVVVAGFFNAIDYFWFCRILIHALFIIMLCMCIYESIICIFQKIKWTNLKIHITECSWRERKEENIYILKAFFNLVWKNWGGAKVFYFRFFSSKFFMMRIFLLSWELFFCCCSPFTLYFFVISCAFYG